MSTPHSPTDAWEARILIANIIGRLRRLSFSLSEGVVVPAGFLTHLDTISNHLDLTTALLPPAAPTPSAEVHPSSTS